MNKFIIFLLAGAVAAGCGGDKKETPKAVMPPKDNKTVAGTTAIDTLINSYMQLKDAFISDNVEKVKAATAIFISHSMPQGGQLAGIQMKSETMFTGICKDLNQRLQNLAAAKDIAGKRRVFKDLLDPMRKIIATQSSVSVFEQHCPMAYSDSGANWLSYETAIQNPFLPRTMLKCGLVQDTLKFVQ
jgi:membrane fusion protein, copper/silver efflux system